MLGVGMAAIFQTYDWDGSAAWVAHTWHVIDQLNHLSSAVEEADRTRVDALIASVRELTRDNVVEQQNLRRLETARVKSAEADVIRDMDAHERGLLASRTERQRQVVHRTRRLFVIASFLSFGLIILAASRASVDFRKRAAAEHALAQREEQYRQVVELAGDIIYRTDASGRFTFCNRTALSVLNLTEDEVIGRSYLKLVRQDYRNQARRFYLRQAVRKRRNSYFEYPAIDGHGRERWLGQNAQLVIDEGQIVGFQAIAREITERKRTEIELERSRGFVERIAATTPGILYVYDLDERRNVYSNREVTSVLGYGVGDIPDEYFHPDDAAALRGHYESLRAAEDGEVTRIDYRARHADGHWVWLAARNTPFLRGPNGVVKQIVGIAQDITMRKTAQERLAWQANNDALTGLSNRHHFRTRLEAQLRRASIEQSTASLCILDIDLFKQINDHFGHAAGDEVLEAVGNITRSELRSNDFAGRLGGDEFCFVLPGTDHDEAARVADRIRERLGTMAFGIAAGGAPFSVTATFGIAQWRPQMESKDLMEAADRALYRAKSAGRNRVCVDV